MTFLADEKKLWISSGDADGIYRTKIVNFQHVRNLAGGGEEMARRQLKYNMRLDMTHEDMRNVHVDPALVPLLALAARNANVSGCAHKSSTLRDKATESWIYYHRDLYMPQRAD